MQLIAQHAVFADQALTIWRQIWAETYIPESTFSFAPNARDFLHQPVASAISFALFVVTFADRVVVLTGPDIQPVVSSFPDHTEWFISSALPAPEPSKFLAFYSKMKIKFWWESRVRFGKFDGTLTPTYSLFSFISSCFVSSFLTEISKAALALLLESRYFAAAAAFSSPLESKP